MAVLCVRRLCVKFCSPRRKGAQSIINTTFPKLSFDSILWWAARTSSIWKNLVDYRPHRAAGEQRHDLLRKQLVAVAFSSSERVRKAVPMMRSRLLIAIE